MKILDGIDSIYEPYVIFVLCLLFTSYIQLCQAIAGQYDPGLINWILLSFNTLSIPVLMYFYKKRKMMK